jgi:hypothetical protein
VQRARMDIQQRRRGHRYILGGGWSDLPYAFNDAYALQQ